MRLESSGDREVMLSGGLHDGYAGTPGDSPLWEHTRYKELVSEEQVWPLWDPRKWVSGQ